MATESAGAGRLIEFELRVRAAVADRTLDTDWGRAFLTPSLPKVWDATSIALEAPGMTIDEVVALADEVLGGAGVEHRTVAVPDAAEGARLAGEIDRAPGWELERLEYMVWRGGLPAEAAEAREADIEEAAPLRLELTAEFMPADQPDRAETAAQLVELDRRASTAAGARWFLAPGAEPESACQLLSGAGIGQVENVVTLQRARGRGLGKAVTLAATRASLQAGHEVTFVAVDADDWPRLMYARLGYERVGGLVVLRRYPT